MELIVAAVISTIMIYMGLHSYRLTRHIERLSDDIDYLCFLMDEGNEDEL